MIAALSCSATDLLNAIERLHPPDQWLFYRELRMGTGYGPWAEGRVDAWAMHLPDASAAQRPLFGPDAYEDSNPPPALPVLPDLNEDGDVTLDGWAMHLYPSRQLRRITYEVKISRGDFLRELKQPTKRAVGLHISNLFYFVMPMGITQAYEVPLETGLLEWTPGGKLHRSKPAPWRKTAAPSWDFLAALARRSALDGTRVRK